MPSDVLARDNTHTNGSLQSPHARSNRDQSAWVVDRSPSNDANDRAVSCTKLTYDPLPDEVTVLVEASVADNSRRAYRSDLAHFVAWGGQLPAEPALVASYLAAYAETLSVATLVRRIATISKAHQARGLPNPAGGKSSVPRCGESNARGGSPSVKQSRYCERTCSGSLTPLARG
jgi:Phage integrase, N-terminal SAM-like domain